MAVYGKTSKAKTTAQKAKCHVGPYSIFQTSGQTFSKKEEAAIIAKGKRDGIPPFGRKP